jgi:hypothetical protein
VAVEVVQMVDTSLRQVVQVVARVETEVIIMVPVPQVKDLEVVQLEVLVVHLLVVEEDLLKLGMTERTIVVLQEQVTLLKVEMVYRILSMEQQQTMQVVEVVHTNLQVHQIKHQVGLVVVVRVEDLWVQDIQQLLEQQI